MKQVELKKTYKTNKGYEVLIVREIREGYYLAKQCDETGCRFHTVDRKGVSIKYVDLFLML